MFKFAKWLIFIQIITLLKGEEQRRNQTRVASETTSNQQYLTLQTRVAGPSRGGGIPTPGPVFLNWARKFGTLKFFIIKVLKKDILN